ncbi:hypothetical protein [Mycolicibacterium sp. GESEQ-9]|uniref:hypothetical protein n=1 Tax=Mycolicibacterium sp. GESEQ-9 TaxID=2812656 RepID=UPI001B33CE41|nr:hypothetical protein [Mycolicibacterium sp. GESEQ-9]
MLTPDNIATLDQRARQVGAAIGWQLRFTVAPNPAYVGLVASDETIGDEIIILGPSRITDLAVHEIDLTLDALERGERHIIHDEDGDPRLI